MLGGKGKITVTQSALSRPLQEGSVGTRSYLACGDFGSPKYSVGSDCRTAVLRAYSVRPYSLEVCCVNELVFQIMSAKQFVCLVLEISCLILL